MCVLIESDVLINWFASFLIALHTPQFALNFYVGQWHRDATTEYQNFQMKEKKGEDSEAAESKALLKCQKRKKFLLRLAQVVCKSGMTKDERDDVRWGDGVTSVTVHQERSV